LTRQGDKENEKDRETDRQTVRQMRREKANSRGNKDNKGAWETERQHTEHRIIRWRDRKRGETGKTKGRQT
jgi:hypothetical protein